MGVGKPGQRPVENMVTDNDNSMTTGRTTLMQKDKDKSNAGSNYRPVTYLPAMWKFLTGIISERPCVFPEVTNTFPHEQKGCKGNAEARRINY